MRQKTEKEILRDKKSWNKSLRIWKKINNKIRLVKEGDYYYVETRENVKSEWKQSPSHGSLKRAIRMKHNLTQRIIRDLGFQPFFKERRIKRRENVCA
jgi:hypothetical protein